VKIQKIGRTHKKNKEESNTVRGLILCFASQKNKRTGQYVAKMGTRKMPLKAILIFVLLMGQFVCGCAMMSSRTYILGPETSFRRSEYAILFVTKENQVTEIDGIPVNIGGRSPEDEVALIPGKHKVKAHHAGRPIRAGSTDFDAQAGHLYKLVREEIPVQNVTITRPGGQSINLGSGSFYSPKIHEVLDKVVILQRFSSTDTKDLIFIKPKDNSTGERK